MCTGTMEKLLLSDEIALILHAKETEVWSYTMR